MKNVLDELRKEVDRLQNELDSKEDFWRKDCESANSEIERLNKIIYKKEDEIHRQYNEIAYYKEQKQLLQMKYDNLVECASATEEREKKLERSLDKAQKIIEILLDRIEELKK